MPITPHDLKDFAERIAQSADETQLRAAISRGYYAAFHAVLPLAARLPESGKCLAGRRYVSHREMYERLVEWRTGAVHPMLSRMIATKGVLARAIDVSRFAREKADYRLEDTIRYADAQSQLERTALILRSMAQLEAELKRGDAA